MRKITILLAFLFIVGIQYASAQTRTISGVVTSIDDGAPIPGVTVQVKGTTIGTVTDIDGKYSINVNPEHTALVFSFVGMKTLEVPIGTNNNITVSMGSEALQMDEVVVTALGVSREKKSLGYAQQELTGGEVNAVKRDNFINNLQGQSAGVNIKGTGNMGGSVNVIIRGNTSLTQNNQALFIVDGVPINNSNNNQATQLTGRNGYDYGNAAADINPNDIESVSILKGAAATALYGSRAANGVILITTKKGSKQVGKSKRYGVSISSNITGGWYDKKTFPDYQNEYGGGYGPYYSDTIVDGQYFPAFEYNYDINGDGTDDWTVPTTEDASFGTKFDPGFSLYQYDSYYPISPNYMKKTPWVVGENGPDYFLKGSLTTSNTVEVAGGGEKATFRLAYTNFYQTGIMPNSELIKNNYNFNGTYEITKNLKVTASANYINTKGKGRNTTGYSDNIMSSFRQWSQRNVDYKMQETLYNSSDGSDFRNYTWNPKSPYDWAPAYWDNPYFQRYESYENDERNGIIGFMMAEWQINDQFSVMGRASIDTYSELQQDRKAYGSASGEFGVAGAAGRPDVTSGYSELSHNFMESNLDMMLKYYNNFGENWNLTALFGTNVRRDKNVSTFASTNGGLLIPGLYTLGNSLQRPNGPDQTNEEIGVNGIYLSASVGFKQMLFLDATIRRDVSSTLPSDNNKYFYPSVSASWLFSENLQADWLQLGKLRAGYAQVGNDAPWGATTNTYVNNFAYGDNTYLYSLPSTSANANLKPEISSSIEAGLEMMMFRKRLGFDFSWYKTNTVNQIIPVQISSATGYGFVYQNAGELQNLGYEVILNGVAIQKPNFRWDITVNWAKNNSKLISLNDSTSNLTLARLQGGVSINATVDQPYGTIMGTDYVYDEATGMPTINAAGYYVITNTSDKVIGNINPDWNMGIKNTFSYKNWSLSALVDWQMGGSVFSVDQWYGQATGVYSSTVFTNNLGNNIRDTRIGSNPIIGYGEESGGFILDGVYAPGVTYLDANGNAVDVSGQQNMTMIRGDRYSAFGYATYPNAAYVYDATYVKLRQVVLSYSIPRKTMENVNWLNGVTFSLVGSNLWLIYKDLPDADPEASQSSGNIQGWQSGVMPTIREIGFTVNLQF